MGGVRNGKNADTPVPAPLQPEALRAGASGVGPAEDAQDAVDRHFRSALRVLREGSAARAFGELARASRKLTMTPRLASALVRFALLAGTEAAAITLLDSLPVSANPEARRAVRRQLARVLRRVGQLRRAIFALELLLAELPGDRRARRVLQVLRKRVEDPAFAPPPPAREPASESGAVLGQLPKLRSGAPVASTWGEESSVTSEVNVEGGDGPPPPEPRSGTAVAFPSMLEEALLSVPWTEAPTETVTQYPLKGAPAGAPPAESSRGPTDAAGPASPPPVDGGREAPRGEAGKGSPPPPASAIEGGRGGAGKGSPAEEPRTRTEVELPAIAVPAPAAPPAQQAAMTLTEMPAVGTPVPASEARGEGAASTTSAGPALSDADSRARTMVELPAIQLPQTPAAASRGADAKRPDGGGSGPGVAGPRPQDAGPPVPSPTIEMPSVEFPRKDDAPPPAPRSRPGPPVWAEERTDEITANVVPSKLPGARDARSDSTSTGLRDEDAEEWIRSQKLEAQLVARRAWRELAQLYLKRADRAKDPTMRAEALTRLAEVMENELQDPAGAARMYREIVELTGDRNALREQVRLLSSRGDTSIVRRALDEAIRRARTPRARAGALLTRGERWLNLGDRKKARADFEAADALAPGLLPVRAGLVRCVPDADRPAAAEKLRAALATAPRRTPDRFEGLKVLAQVAEESLKDLRLAQWAWGEVLAESAEGEQAHGKLAALARRLGDMNALGQLLRTQLAREPRGAAAREARMELVTSLEAVGDMDGALAELRQAVRFEPGHKEAWLLLVNRLIARNNMGEAAWALEHAATAMEDEEERGRAWERLARLWSEVLENPERAQVYARRAESLKLAREERVLPLPEAPRGAKPKKEAGGPPQPVFMPPPASVSLTPSGRSILEEETTSTTDASAPPAMLDGPPIEFEAVSPLLSPTGARGRANPAEPAPKGQKAQAGGAPVLAPEPVSKGQRAPAGGAPQLPPEPVSKGQKAAGAASSEPVARGPKAPAVGGERQRGPAAGGASLPPEAVPRGQKAPASAGAPLPPESAPRGQKSGATSAEGAPSSAEPAARGQKAPAGGPGAEPAARGRKAAAPGGAPSAENDPAVRGAKPSAALGEDDLPPSRTQKAAKDAAPPARGERAAAQSGRGELPPAFVPSRAERARGRASPVDEAAIDSLREEGGSPDEPPVLATRVIAWEAPPGRMDPVRRIVRPRSEGTSVGPAPGRPGAKPPVRPGVGAAETRESPAAVPEAPPPAPDEPAALSQIRERPLEPQPYRTLADNFAERGDSARSSLMREIADALEGRESPAPRLVLSKLSTEERAGLRHPGLRTPSGDLLACTGLALCRLFPAQGRAAGSAEPLRASSGPGAPAILDALHVTARLLDVNLPELVLAEDDGPPFTAVHAGQPRLLVGRLAVRQAFASPELRFHAGRALLSLSPDLLALRTLKGTQFLRALALLSTLLKDSRNNSPEARIVRESLSPKALERAAALLEPGTRNFDASALADAARDSANRAGLVACGGVGPAIAVLRDRRGHEAELTELVKFAASERYLALRLPR